MTQSQHQLLMAIRWSVVSSQWLKMIQLCNLCVQILWMMKILLIFFFIPLMSLPYNIHKSLFNIDLEGWIYLYSAPYESPFCDQLSRCQGLSRCCLPNNTNISWLHTRTDSSLLCAFYCIADPGHSNSKCQKRKVYTQKDCMSRRISDLESIFCNIDIK